MSNVITVITPSLNMGRYLRLCMASVADQGIRNVEHLVVDGGSHDDTHLIVREYPSVHLRSGKDAGMYDALNKGLVEATGDLIGYLNCDEQYLPGTFARVSAFMAANPAVDMLFGDALLIDQQGELVAFRKGYPPRWPYLLSSHLYLLSCTMFFRRRIIDAGYRFDSSFRVLGDLEFVVRIMRAGFRCVHVSGYGAAFMMTGRNLSMSPQACVEWKRIRRGMPCWVRCLRLPLNGARLLEKALHGAYFQSVPLTYEVFTAEDTSARKRFVEFNPRHRWRFIDAAHRY